MSQPAEIPDSHVVCLADQFRDTAVLLLANVPKVVAPSALTCNAAFAIELYLKSLNSHWVLNRTFYDEFVEVFAVTTKANTKNVHKLNVLFDALPQTTRDELEAKFNDHTLAQRYKTLQGALDEYSDAFTRKRYGYEYLPQNHSRPIRDVVELATFFHDYVHAMTPARY